MVMDIQVEDPMAMVVVIQVVGPMAMVVTQVVGPMVMEVTQVGDPTAMVVALGMEAMRVIPAGMGLEDHTNCLGEQLLSGRVLQLLAGYCEDFTK